MGSKAKLKRLGVLSVAKISMSIMAVAGLITGIVFASVSLMAANIANPLAAGSFGIAAGTFAGGVASAAIAGIITIPIIYAILGFVGGAIGAILYNFFAGKVGGIEMEFEETQ